MKLESKYFDSIRVSSKRQRAAAPAREREAAHSRCQWKGCKSPADHKAPRGRGRDGQYYHFCLEHVRQYNATYNYFDGMNDTEVQDFQKDAMTGHRPTWKVGANAPPPEGAASAPPPDPAAAPESGPRTMDPHSFFARRERAARQRAEATAGKRRPLKPLEKKSLETLDLSIHASGDDIKARFKALVKIYHPDANGGDARSGDKLREIIQAYNFLKQAGLV